MKIEFSRIRPVVDERSFAWKKAWDSTSAIHDLAKFSQCLMDAKIPHWVTYGSLLGLVRDGALIPWDHDVDCAFPPGVDFAAIDVCLSKAGTPVVQTVSVDGRVVVAKCMVGSTSCDIFMLSEQKGKLLDFGGQSSHIVIYSHVKSPVVMRKFGEYQLPVPEDAERYLAHIYGPKWRVPAKRWNWKYSTFNREGVRFIGLAGVWFYCTGWLVWQKNRLFKT